MNEHLLRQAIRQDMEWIINAPPLLATGPNLWPQSRITELDSELPDSALTPLFQARNGKLGRYFEALVFTLFENSPHYRTLACNETLHDGSTTLGELDLLLEDLRSGEILHVELAVKFYLWTGGEAEQQGWIGAGLHDFFDRKLHRLASHQLPLPHIAQRAHAWPGHLPMPDQDLLWMPGRLYLPANGNQTKAIPQISTQLPWILNSQSEPSYWFEADQYQQPHSQALQKAEWLCGKPTAAHEKPLPAQFIDSKHPFPVYLVPPGWQTSAQQTMTHYYQAL